MAKLSDVNNTHACSKDNLQGGDSEVKQVSSKSQDMGSYQQLVPNALEWK